MGETKKKAAASGRSAAAKSSKAKNTRSGSANKKKNSSTAGRSQNARRTQHASGSTQNTRRNQHASGSAQNTRRNQHTSRNTQNYRRSSASGNRRYSSGTPLIAEVTLWIVLVLCLLAMLSMYFRIGGVLGRAVANLFFGLFGLPAFLMPILFGIAAAFLTANRMSFQSVKKVLTGLLLTICLCTFCELLANSFESVRTLSDYWRTGIQLHTGGGIAGGIFCKVFCPLLGEIGTWMITLLFLIVSIILMTGQSLFDRIQGSSRRTRQSVRRTTGMRRELRQQKRRTQDLTRQRQLQKELMQERQLQKEIEQDLVIPRRERRVSGVSVNTKIGSTTSEARDIHEVVPRLKQSSADQVPVQTQAAASAPDTASKQRQNQDATFTVSGYPDSEFVTQELFSNPEKAYPFEEPSVSFSREDAQPAASREFVPAEEEPAVSGPEHRTVSVVAQRTDHPELTPQFDEPEEEFVEELPFAPSSESITPVQKAAPDPEPTEEPSLRTSVRNPKSTKEEQEMAVSDVAKEIEAKEGEKKDAYVFPPIDLLAENAASGSGARNEVRETAAKLQQTLDSFGVHVTVTNVSCGPAVTRYELTPDQGVKVSRIVNLADDIKLNLAASDIRIEAPIPGKSAVGIEVPNKETSAVFLRELIESEEFQNAKSRLAFAVGRDIAGKVVVADIAKMPHLLIAGATGSGKSVCINTLIMSILYKADPEDVKLIMIDPKVVELSVYNGIPHLFIPVVTDPKKASGALNWGVAEMTDRYAKFADCGVRDLKGYNQKIPVLAEAWDRQNEAAGGTMDPKTRPKKLPQIVIIVDELADLMMVAPGEVEDAICRLAQLARAAGIHLIIATQRPSVNVITGLIKANMPSRIAFSVTSGIDSRTILDMQGAEKLLGKGDMLFYPQGYQKPVRVQGALVTDTEVSAVTDFLTNKNDVAAYQKDMEERLGQVAQAQGSSLSAGGAEGDTDAHFADAGKFIIEKDKASIGMLQRVFKIGFNRAARIMDQLADAGVVGPEEGTKPRKILMTMDEFEQYLESH
ncbi:MAG: DNA translocase FtsK [Eubacteriales bacterium]|nr:DNA translocase FtsK [Eubacteriales bacterium]